MFFKNKNNLGFTLIEILVVLVIMIALAMLVIGGHSEGRPRLALERTAEAFAMDLYRAREKGFSSMIYNDGTNLIEDGFGIMVVAGDTKYYLYAGKNEQEIIEEIRIETLIKIDNVSPSDGGELRIFFSSDEKKVLFNEQSIDNGKVVFVTDDGMNVTREININKSGIAEIVYE
jgi:type II secretory pathway pseudopilin PulG